MIRRTAALLTTILLATASLATPVLASPSEEARFVDLINQERAGRGLNTLEVYWDLIDDARIHADVMSNADEIFHSSNLAGVTTGWSVLGENVGVGPAVDILHGAFMKSTGHRDNVLGDWDSVGVGVTHSDAGYMFVTVLFMKSAEAKPAPALPAVTPPPALDPMPPLPAIAPAPAPEPNGVAAVASAEPTPTPQPVSEPEPPAPPPQPANRLVDDLLAGADFPFSLE